MGEEKELTLSEERDRLYLKIKEYMNNLMRKILIGKGEKVTDSYNYFHEEGVAMLGIKKALSLIEEQDKEFIKIICSGMRCKWREDLIKKVAGKKLT